MSYILIRVTEQFHEDDANGDDDDEKSASTKTTLQGSSAKTLPTFRATFTQLSLQKTGDEKEPQTSTRHACISHVHRNLI